MRFRATGFTVIEMVVAFAILTMALTVIYSSFEMSLNRAGHDHQTSQATLIAQSLLARTGTEWNLSQDNLTGHEANFDYELRAEPILAPSGETAFTLKSAKVTVVVRWPHESDTHSVALSTIKWSGTLQ